MKYKCTYILVYICTVFILIITQGGNIKNTPEATGLIGVALEKKLACEILVSSRHSVHVPK